MLDLIDEVDTVNYRYNRTNTCTECGKDLIIDSFPRRKYNTGESWTWICNACYAREARKRPDSHNNLRKKLQKCRNKQLSKNSNTGKGFIGEQIWCKYRGTKNCNIERDNFHSKEDTIDSEYGIVQIKLATLTNGEWNIQFKNYSFDTAILLFMDIDMKSIERVCIIPVKELGNMVHFKIKKDGKYIYHSKAAGICNKFYVNQNTCNEINDIYHNMSLDDCPILRKE